VWSSGTPRRRPASISIPAAISSYPMVADTSSGFAPGRSAARRVTDDRDAFTWERASQAEALAEDGLVFDAISCGTPGTRLSKLRLGFADNYLVSRGSLPSSHMACRESSPRPTIPSDDSTYGIRRPTRRPLSGMRY
jgi:hypothetical protein